MEVRSIRLGSAILAAAALALAGCGGGTDSDAPSLESSYTVPQVKEAFAAGTGEQLTLSESEFGGPPRLVFEEDGDP